jgi:hypothetical protein
VMCVHCPFLIYKKAIKIKDRFSSPYSKIAGRSL